MRKVLFVVVCAAFSLVFWMAHSDAQMCECKGEGMQGCGKMGGMMEHKGMEMMRGGMHGGMMEGDRPMLHTLRELNLDEKQKESLNAIKSKAMKEAIRKGAEMRIAEMEQKDLLDKDPVDMKAVEAKVRQIEAMRSDMHLLHIKTTEEVKLILTPEQRKKFKETIEKGPMAGGMGMMHGEDCGMMKGEECGMMGGMMQPGSMEEGMSEPSGKKEGAAPAEHKHH